MLSGIMKFFAASSVLIGSSLAALSTASNTGSELGKEQEELESARNLAVR
jgi:hypothetical protein